MPLYSYRKAPTTINPQQEKDNREQRYKYKNKRKPLTVGDVIVGLYNDFHNLMSTSRVAALLVPTILVFTGIWIIYNQVWPTVIQVVQDKSGYFSDTGAALVEGAYIEADVRYSNPGAKYFAELKNKAQRENVLYKDDASLNYKNAFSLTIPSLDLYDLKVTPNTDSSVESVYDQILTDGLAHFSGTPLPFTELPYYNTVIYGHSSAGDYYQRTKDPAASFSILSQLRYGSEILVKMDGKQYKYKFIKGKIVDANDLSILEGNSGQKQLTLFTCYPNGNNEKRFVATARLVEG